MASKIKVQIFFKKISVAGSLMVLLSENYLQSRQNLSPKPPPSQDKKNGMSPVHFHNVLDGQIQTHSLKMERIRLQKESGNTGL